MVCSNVRFWFEMRIACKVGLWGNGVITSSVFPFSLVTLFSLMFITCGIKTYLRSRMDESILLRQYLCYKTIMSCWVTYARHRCKVRALSVYLTHIKRENTTSLTFCKVWAVALWDRTREYICIHSSVFHLLELFAMISLCYLYLFYVNLVLRCNSPVLQSLNLFKIGFVDLNYNYSLQ